jgi:DNA-binding transcriptional regulator YiaG
MNSRARSPAFEKRAAKHSDAALRRYLKKEGMSRTQFAKMGGWPLSTVSRWFHGKFPTDNQKAMIQIITHGEVQVGDWFKGLPHGGHVGLTLDQTNRIATGESVRVRLNGRYTELVMCGA